MIGVITSVVAGSGGGVTGVAAVLRDLTSVREMEEQVRRAERLSALGVLAAGIAHEVRNPLAGVRGAAQLLGSEIRDNQALAPYTDVIVREVDRLDRIVTGLLPFASPRTFSYGPVNIHSVLTASSSSNSHAPRRASASSVSTICPSSRPAETRNSSRRSS
jgi:two-component system nitrogen regulation sensor histidine kinase GlnL